MTFGEMENIWIKGAVEHRKVSFHYYSGKTKKEHTIRTVEPDYIGRSSDGHNIGFWATYDYFRGEGPRCFTPANISNLELLDETFSPRPRSRWKEMISEYESRELGA